MEQSTAVNKYKWIGNCSQSHALGEVAGSRRTLLHMQQRAAGGHLGRHDAVPSRTILPNFIPIRSEKPEPYSFLKSVAPATRRRRRTASR